jgi:hypothetical protein
MASHIKSFAHPFIIPPKKYQTINKIINSISQKN